MLQFTGRESQYCVSAVGGFTGGFAHREGGMATGLLCQWPLLLLALLATVMITESVNAGVIKLNGELTSGGDVDYKGLQFSPDGSRVLYNADQDTDGVFELYSVSAAGGEPVKLNEKLPLFLGHFLAVDSGIIATILFIIAVQLHPPTTDSQWSNAVIGAFFCREIENYKNLFCITTPPHEGNYLCLTVFALDPFKVVQVIISLVQRRFPTI